ncbi:flavin reductase family protein [Streptomyces sp. NPDC059008]|uniref:flavin reductase family protein n=1 Tax=Streptomyces sp. NPDC059008 TaxID=3346693 RepID=UPI0036C96A1D
MTGTPLESATVAASQDSDAQALRAVSRQLPTGVSVLTTAHHGVVHAATVSTTSVVCQRPLTLSVSLRRGSLMGRLAVESGQFLVNVLSSRQALLADWFANPERPPGQAQFDLIKWEPDDATGLPVLCEALARLVCRVTDHVQLGQSDDLVIAEVLGGTAGRGRPLVNFDGQLHDVEFRDVVRRQSWRTPGMATAALD